MKYQQFEHTGDIGVKIFGATLKELFENAAFALFDVMTDIKKIEPHAGQEIIVKADDFEELLVNWLSELNFLFQTEFKLFSQFEITEIDYNNLKATAFGEKIDPKRHEIETEIKAVTFHQLKIELTPDGWQGRIIFDI
jgi:SHS2 domain-containing protein